MEQTREFQAVTPADLPKPLQRWLQQVIQDQESFQKISIFGRQGKYLAYAFWFDGNFSDIQEAIRSFPKSFSVHQVQVLGSSLVFHCDRRRPQHTGG